MIKLDSNNHTSDIRPQTVGMCCSDNPTLKHANCLSVSNCWRQSLNRTKHDKWQMFEPPNISQSPSTPFLFGALILFLYSTGLSSNTFKASSFHEDQWVRSVQGLENCVHCHLASCTENGSPNCLGPRLPEPHGNFPMRPLIGWDCWTHESVNTKHDWIRHLDHDNLVASTYSHSEKRPNLMPIPYWMSKVQSSPAKYVWILVRKNPTPVTTKTCWTDPRFLQMCWFHWNLLQT